MSEERYDEEKEEFTADYFTLQLEHSLVSLSKWESHFEVPFLAKDERTNEQALWYVQAMTLTPDVPPEIWSRLTEENVNQVNEYVMSKQSATTIHENGPKTPGRQTITSEIIYGWMVTLNIPFECQYWHLNRLINLIKVVNHNNQPAKKMSKREAAAQQRRINQQRRAQAAATSG